MVKMINFMSNIHTTRKNNRINTTRKKLKTYMTQGTIISEMSIMPPLPLLKSPVK